MGLVDETYMQQVLKLAEKGRGRTSPNPMVGSVVVKSGKVVGKGYHHRAGEPHAEVNALKMAGSRARGATLYINLEPCCHLGKRTPPCTQIIINSGIRRVVLSMRDPNPKVNGRGILALREAGIEIVKGILEEKSLKLNEFYIKYVRTMMPFVILKTAMTIDGKIALRNTVSTWITGKPARTMAHHLRDQVDAVIVGIKTILVDNPRLTTRIPGKRKRDPHRIILDSRLRISLDARVLNKGSSASTFIATTSKAPKAKIKALQEKGAVVLVIPDKNKKVNLLFLVRKLGRMGISSIMIEGGAHVNASALKARVVDKLVLFIAPRLMGGSEAVGFIGGSTPDKLAKMLKLRDIRCRRLGDDFMVEGYFG